MAPRSRRWLTVLIAAVAPVAVLAYLRMRATIPPPEGVATGPSDGARWREPIEGDCPVGYPVKASRSGIYHLEGGRSYDRTTPERCYATAEDAEADGYRRAKA
jgi:hypothetical protein